MNKSIKKLFGLFLLIPCVAYAAAINDSSISSFKFVPGFGNGGYANFATATTFNDMVIDSFGRIVAVGTNGTNNGLIARYNSNGTLDTSFSTDGFLVDTNFTTFYAVKIDSSGNIVVGGTNGGTNVLARYTTAGLLDGSFSGDGIATATALKLQTVYDFAFDSSGKIVVVGKNNGTAAAIARFTAGGAIDTDFDGVDGYFDNTGTNALQYTSIAIDSSGNIFVAGNTASPQAIIAKYTKNVTFSLDGNFGTNGVASLLGSYYINTLKIDSSGKIVVAGEKSAGSSVIARFNSNGSPDTSFFNSSGQVGSDTIAGNYNKLVIDTNGKIVLVGKKSGGFGSEGVIARYDSDGWLDTTFNKTGCINVENGTDSQEFKSVGLDHKGRIVAAGLNDEDEGLIIRYLANGTLDAAGNWNSNSLIEHFESQGLKLNLLSSGR